MLINNKINLSVLILLISYYESTKDIISDLITDNMMISEESISLYRLGEIISYGKQTLKIDGSILEDNILGEIRFKNVCFSYDT